MLAISGGNKRSSLHHLCCRARPSVSVLAGQAEDAEVTWRSLYACSNGWRGLRPGCFEMLGCRAEQRDRMVGQATLRTASWTAGTLAGRPAAGGASELLVVVDLDDCAGESRIVCSCIKSALPAGMPLADDASCGRQVIDCKARQLLQRCSYRQGSYRRQLYHMHRRSASRAHCCRQPGIDVLALEWPALSGTAGLPGPACG